MDADHDILAYCNALDTAQNSDVSLQIALENLTHRHEICQNRADEISQHLDAASPRNSASALKIELQVTRDRRNSLPAKPPAAAHSAVANTFMVEHLYRLMGENKRLSADNRSMERARMETADEVQLLEVPHAHTYITCTTRYTAAANIPCCHVLSIN